MSTAARFHAESVSAQPLLDRLGKHKTGKACLYVNKLSVIDLDVLADLIRAGLADLDTHWPVQPT